ncbi:MAG: hypothetical protein HY905_18825 [Deltaproteobacteria bacterium]|nr:hypothetical protein [Deltaproteobacteria bacterium]
MNAPDGTADREPALAFFGAASAGLSHEINNVLAIINELAGLIGDVVAAAERADVRADGARLRAVLERVSAQIARGKEQVRLLNRFAHSVDGPTGGLDGSEVLSLAVALGQRAARLRKVALATVAAEAPLRLPGGAFEFLHLFHRSLGLALARAKPGSGVEVRVIEDAGEAVVRLEVAECAPTADAAWPALLAEAIEVAARHGARLDTVLEPGQPGHVSLRLPAAPGAGPAGEGGPRGTRGA